MTSRLSCARPDGSDHAHRFVLALALAEMKSSLEVVPLHQRQSTSSAS